MSHVIAKMHDKEKPFKKLFSGENLYSIPQELETATEYAEHTILEDGEWFKLELFSKREYFPSFLGENLNTTEYELFRSNEINRLEYIYSYENNAFCFQRIFRQNIMQKKRLSVGDNVELKENETCIIINNMPDAIYIKEKDTLYFRKLETIAPIFDGIYTLYKEATKEETEKFLNESFIALVDSYNADKVGKMNRKRISMAIESLKKFTKKERKKILEYTNSYYPELNYANGKFEIGNDTDMKFLLWGIEQRYYTTPINNEKRVANSIVVLQTS